MRSHFRKARLRETVSVQPLDGDDPPSDFDTQRMAEGRETATWLEKAIRQLPLPMREATLMCCIEEMPQSEAAGALGIPLNTLKTHLRRARLTLAEALARRNQTMGQEVSS